MPEPAARPLLGRMDLGHGDQGWGWWCPGCLCHHLVNGGWTVRNPESERPTISPSVRVSSSRDGVPYTVCHCYVQDGRIQFLGDSAHMLAGQTVDMLPFEPLEPPGVREGLEERAE